jgi:hypothetical protein
MTRFCGDAVGVRSRPKNFATGKERRRDMEARFWEADAAVARSSLASAPAEPERRAAPRRCSSAPGGTRTWSAGRTRTRCPTSRSATSTGSTSSSTCARGQRRWVRSPAGRPPSTLPVHERGARIRSGAHCCAGRLLVEVFEDAAPLAARFFLNRCREGSSEALQGTCVHRLQPEMAFFFGKSRGCVPRGGLCVVVRQALSAGLPAGLLLCGRLGGRPVGRGAAWAASAARWRSLFLRPCVCRRRRHKGGAAVRRYPGLHHMAAGAVSVSRGGDEVAVTLGRALALDPSHQARGALGPAGGLCGCGGCASAPMVATRAL